MKRLLLSSLTALLTMTTFAAVASAGQVSLSNSDADLNGDGTVTLTELKQYNREQRHA